MSDEEEEQEERTLFANDGNFLERFKKMEEEKKKKEKEESEERNCASKQENKEPTLPLRRKHILMKRPHPLAKKKSKVSTIEQHILTDKEEAPSSAATLPTKPKRKSRWGEPLSNDAQLMVSAITSFQRPSITDNIAKVRQQIMEQQELHKATLNIQKAISSRATTNLEDKSLELTEKEHLMRYKEMELTAEKSQELTDANEGKHFIGDFLPADQLAKFIEKTNSVKEQKVISDFNDQKISSDNLGYRLLQKAGWKEGEGLGMNEDGILDPINKGKATFDQLGVGASNPGDIQKDDDQFDIYRKRMMLAYRFRPNPLNNPRRPYY